MDIQQSTQKYEYWLQSFIPVVTSDVAYKHLRMKESPFPFFRATFYNWCLLWPLLCPKLAKAPKVLSVADLHIENFGTWRDSQGRLAWGVNDFDEAIPLPFTHDLVRLTVSTLLASDKGPLSPDRIVQEILDGYTGVIENGGTPYVLEEAHTFLRHQLESQTRKPEEYWPHLIARLSPPTEDIPETALKVFRKSLPKDAEPTYHTVTKPKGLGSLGRRRYIALAQWRGGWIAREIKDTLPSAVLWATSTSKEAGNPWLMKTVEAAVRSPDPYYDVRRQWLIRRLAPDCSRIEWTTIEDPVKLAKLLHSMGKETANIHLGSPKAQKTISGAWKKLPEDWLLNAARALQDRTISEWSSWCKST